MKRFLIHVSTYWCGMDNTFRAVAESEMDLWDLAEQLAYDNFQSYSCENDIAEEEAIEEVKNGKQDCYDSELLYETVIELSPEDNNGNPTREIYDNLNDTLVWDNSSVVNRGDIITQNLRDISDQLFRIMESEPEEFNAGCVSFASVKEVLEKLGWTDISSIDTDGWDIDYWVTFIKEGKDFNYIVSGNLYYGNINIRKEKF